MKTFIVTFKDATGAELRREQHTTEFGFKSVMSDAQTQFRLQGGKSSAITRIEIELLPRGVA